MLGHVVTTSDWAVQAGALRGGGGVLPANLPLLFPPNLSTPLQHKRPAHFAVYGVERWRHGLSPPYAGPAPTYAASSGLITHPALEPVEQWGIATSRCPVRRIAPHFWWATRILVQPRIGHRHQGISHNNLWGDEPFGYTHVLNVSGQTKILHLGVQGRTQKGA